MENLYNNRNCYGRELLIADGKNKPCINPNYAGTCENCSVVQLYKAHITRLNRDLGIKLK